MKVLNALDFRPSNASEESTEDDARLTTGWSTTGNLSKESRLGAGQYSFLSKLLGEVEEPGWLHGACSSVFLLLGGFEESVMRAQLCFGFRWLIGPHPEIGC